MPYQIEFRPSARKAIGALPRNVFIRIRSRIDALSANPRPTGCVKLSGTASTYRIRIGDYRVVYDVHDDRRIVIILIVAHRRDVYRGL